MRSNTNCALVYKMASRYLDKFEELEVIGRGNFGNLYLGVAQLIQSKVNNKKYVAKKINLITLDPRE